MHLYAKLTLMPEQKTRWSSSEVARRGGIHKDTLLRWLKAGLVAEPARDRHGWRSFTEDEAQLVEQFAKTGADPLLPGQSTLEKLSSLDWNFAGAKTGYLTHAIHPYPAKFIPQIPNALIQELSSVGDTVGDIFCGSGTTLVEAVTLKRHAVGIDANPLACLISRCKTAFVGEDDVLEIEELRERAKIASVALSEREQQGLFPATTFKSDGWRPAAPKLSFWFAPHVIEELAEILLWCKEIKSANAQRLALVAFSSIIVTVSKQDSDTRYVRREKNTLPGDAFRRFSKAIDAILRACKEFTDLAEPRFECQVVEKNLLDEPLIPLMDLMVCSPPYPNAFSYHLYHMTRMLWLDMDQPLFKRQEIGSHRKYSSPGKNAATVETFKDEFTRIMRWLHPNLRQGGHACFIVGNSTVKGEQIDNAQLIADIGTAAGFREIGRIERTMQANKKSFNPAIGRIKKETILVMERRHGWS